MFSTFLDSRSIQSLPQATGRGPRAGRISGSQGMWRKMVRSSGRQRRGRESVGSVWLQPLLGLLSTVLIKCLREQAP